MDDGNAAVVDAPTSADDGQRGDDMTDDEGGGDGRDVGTTVGRRSYLATVTAVGAALVGCSALPENDGESTATTPPATGTATPTVTSTDTADSTPTGTTAPADLTLSAPRVETTPVRQTRPIVVTVDATNDGDAQVDASVTLSVRGGRSDSVSVVLDAGRSRSVTVETRAPHVGDRTVEATLSVGDETLASTATEVAVRPYPTSFVGRDGTRFTTDEGAFRYVGVNNNHLPVEAWGRQYVDRLFDYLTDHGVSVVRTWGFPAAWTGTEVHAGPGEFRDDWFDHFDYVVLAAKRHDVRLVLPLLNNWGDATHAPTPAAYADWSPTAETKNDFFEDDRAIQYYRNYVEHVLTHRNRLTGVEYRNDPTILLWEVGNEIEYHGDRRGEPLTEWYDAAARHIKSIDDEHLVGSGMHGATGDVYERWNVRNAYVETHESDAIDACSFHSYPATRRTDDGVGEQEAFAEYVRTHVREAHERVGKPAYLGEFGVAVGPDQPPSARDEYLRTATRVAHDERLTGVQFWFAELRDPTDDGRRRTHADNPLAIFPDESSSWGIIDDYARRLR